MVMTSPYEHLSPVQTLGEGDERLNINLYRTLLKAVNIPIKYSFPISPFHLSTERFLENIQKKTFGYILPEAYHLGDRLLILPTEVTLSSTLCKIRITQ